MRLDIGWTDITAGLSHCVFAHQRERLQQKVERHWSREGNALACLSVRTGFDLLLKSLKLPPQSEVLISALTIKDMVRIIEENGLIPVPVDLDLNRLAPACAQIAAAITPQTRVILIAHLFGTRLNLEPVLNLAREHELVMIEDCAQAYVGPTFTGHPQVDVSMFSFGPIKTATALSGGILKVNNRAILEAMRQQQATYPVQDRWFFFKRLLKYSSLKFGSQPLIYDLMILLWRTLGKDYDQVVSQTVKGFPGPDFFRRIRKQPSAPVLALLLRRLRRFNARGLAERTAKGERLAELLGSVAFRPGETVPRHSYWVFPVMAEASDRLIAALRAEGFDAAQGHSLYVVDAPTDRPAQNPAAAREAREKIVYLPWFTDFPLARMERMAQIVRDHCQPHAAQAAHWRSAALESPAAVAAEREVGV
jgi:dTDP-4-amino-4,6-dideoxygalactose transaminase